VPTAPGALPARISALAEEMRRLATTCRMFAREFEAAAARAGDPSDARREIVAALTARRLAANEERIAEILEDAETRSARGALPDGPGPRGRPAERRGGDHE
jgi:hypothetical protein